MGVDQAKVATVTADVEKDFPGQAQGAQLYVSFDGLDTLIRLDHFCKRFFAAAAPGSVFVNFQSLEVDGLPLIPELTAQGYQYDREMNAFFPSHVGLATFTLANKEIKAGLARQDNSAQFTSMLHNVRTVQARSRFEATAYFNLKLAHYLKEAGFEVVYSGPLCRAALVPAGERDSRDFSSTKNATLPEGINAAISHNNAFVEFRRDANVPAGSFLEYARIQVIVARKPGGDEGSLARALDRRAALLKEHEEAVSAARRKITDPSPDSDSLMELWQAELKLMLIEMGLPAETMFKDADYPAFIRSLMREFLSTGDFVDRYKAGGFGFESFQADIVAKMSAKYALSAEQVKRLKSAHIEFVVNKVERNTDQVMRGEKKGDSHQKGQAFSEPEKPASSDMEAPAKNETSGIIPAMPPYETFIIDARTGRNVPAVIEQIAPEGKIVCKVDGRVVGSFEYTKFYAYLPVIDTPAILINSLTVKKDSRRNKEADRKYKYIGTRLLEAAVRLSLLTPKTNGAIVLISHKTNTGAQLFYGSFKQFGLRSFGPLSSDINWYLTPADVGRFLDKINLKAQAEPSSASVPPADMAPDAGDLIRDISSIVKKETSQSSLKKDARSRTWVSAYNSLIYKLLRMQGIFENQTIVYHAAGLDAALLSQNAPLVVAVNDPTFIPGDSATYTKQVNGDPPGNLEMLIGDARNEELMRTSMKHVKTSKVTVFMKNIEEWMLKRSWENGRTYLETLLKVTDPDQIILVGRRDSGFALDLLKEKGYEEFTAWLPDKGAGLLRGAIDKVYSADIRSRQASGRGDFWGHEHGIAQSFDIPLAESASSWDSRAYYINPVTDLVILRKKQTTIRAINVKDGAILQGNAPQAQAKPGSSDMEAPAGTATETTKVHAAPVSTPVANIDEILRIYSKKPYGTLYRLDSMPDDSEILRLWKNKRKIEFAVFSAVIDGKPNIFVLQGDSDSFGLDTGLCDFLAANRIPFLIHNHPPQEKRPLPENFRYDDQNIEGWLAANFSAKGIPSPFPSGSGLGTDFFGIKTIEKMYVYTHERGYVEYGEDNKAQISEFGKVAFDVHYKDSPRETFTMNDDNALFGWGVSYLEPEGIYLYRRFIESIENGATKVKLRNWDGRFAIWDPAIRFSSILNMTALPQTRSGAGVKPDSSDMAAPAGMATETTLLNAIAAAEEFENTQQQFDLVYAAERVADALAADAERSGGKIHAQELEALKILASAERIDDPYIRKREHFIACLSALCPAHPEVARFLAERLTTDSNRFVRSACARALESLITRQGYNADEDMIGKIRQGCKDESGYVGEICNRIMEWLTTESTKDGAIQKRPALKAQAESSGAEASPAGISTEVAPTALPQTRSGADTVEAERINAVQFADIVKLVKAANMSQPVILALGTDWIKGYKRGTPQYNDLNRLISAIRNYCTTRGIVFVNTADEGLLAAIEKERKAAPNAKVIVLAGKDSIAPDKALLAPLRDDENTFLAAVDPSELDETCYVRLAEMLRLALELGLKDLFRDKIDLTNPNIDIGAMKDFRNVYVFLPHAERIKSYDDLRALYRVQEFA
jgi:hypothetical protein